MNAHASSVCCHDASIRCPEVISAALRQQEVGGNVQLWLLVDTRGAGADVRVTNGSGHPVLGVAA